MSGPPFPHWLQLTCHKASLGQWRASLKWYLNRVSPLRADCSSTVYKYNFCYSSCVVFSCHFVLLNYFAGHLVSFACSAIFAFALCQELVIISSVCIMTWINWILSHWLRMLQLALWHLIFSCHYLWLLMHISTDIIMCMYTSSQFIRTLYRCWYGQLFIILLDLSVRSWSKVVVSSFCFK